MAKATNTTTSTVQQIDPRTLLVDVNVRRETLADKDFIASVKDLGVLQPVRAVRTADGALRVETGHRRTLAAIEAGQDTVPVLVVADEQTDDAGTVDRIVRQYAENEHRAGLTNAERVDVVEQLSLLKVSAAQIAKRTRIKRPDVDNAIAVTKSDLAKAASERYDLTLDQAAAVAEFEDDEEAVKALVASIKTGRFDHVLATARQKRSDAQARAEINAQIEVLGVRVTEDTGWSGAARALDRLTTGDDDPVTETDHAKCPGHVAWADEKYVCVLPDGTIVEEDDDAVSDEQYEAATSESRWMIVYGCDNPSLYGHKVDGYLRPVASVSAAAAAAENDPERAAALEAERERRSEERRRVIANNKAWDTATEVRVRWVTDHLAARKSLPKGTGAFVAEALRQETHVLSDGRYEVTRLGWLSDDDAAWLRDVTDGRAQVVALLLILAAYERQADRDSWRHAQRCVVRYLQWLHATGYPLADVERLAAGLSEDPDTGTEAADAGAGDGD